MLVVLVTRSVFRQHQHRSGGPVPDHADAGPDVDRFGQAVSTFGNEDDSLVGGLLDFIDRLLKGVGVIGKTVTMHGEIIPRQVDRFGVVQTDGVIRGSPQWDGCHQCGEERDNSFQHE